MATLLAEQDGVVAWWQLRDDPAALARAYRRLNTGRWQAPHRGVFVHHSGPLPSSQRRWAAVLAAGPGAALRGATAVSLAGVTGFETPEISVAVPDQRRGPKLDGVDVARLRRLEALVHPARRPPRLRVHDAVIDLAASDDDAHAVLCAAVQQGKSTAQRLREALDRRRRLPRAVLIRESLLDIADGCQSINESALRRLVREAGLPDPVLQVHVATANRRSYIDGGWPDYEVWYEVDGELHLEPARWAEDLDRGNELAIEQGGLRLRWSGFVVRRHPDRVADQARRALERNGSPG